jgi:hypothetical protein
MRRSGYSTTRAMSKSIAKHQLRDPSVTVRGLLTGAHTGAPRSPPRVVRRHRGGQLHLALRLYNRRRAAEPK